MRMVQCSGGRFCGNIVPQPESVKDRCGDFFITHRFFFIKTHARFEGGMK